MSSVKVVDIVNRVETVLQDSNIRWPREELQDWLNDSYRAIISIRPDANTKTDTFTCAVGTRQVLTAQFTSALRLIDVIRNMEASSNKSAVRQIERIVLDDQRPGWHAETGTVNIEHFMYDPRVPKEFLVYPPALATTELEVAYADTPTGHSLTEAQLAPDSGTTDVIQLDDIYAGPILDFILYRSYSKDAGYAENIQRATDHYNAFLQALDVKTKTDVAVAPKVQGDVT